MFWENTDTIRELMGQDYQAWSLFGPVHWFWLSLTVFFTFLIWKYYPTLPAKQKRKILIGMAVLMVLDELWKDIPNLILGQFQWEHLPFHLCSVNIIAAAVHTLHETRTTKVILSCVCIPAAFCALIMPNSTCLPMWNFMHLHTQTIHMMLFLYPMLVLADGFTPLRKDHRIIAVYLVALTLFDKVINRILHTNFLFLTHNENNPALIFLQKHTGPFYNVGIVVFLIVFCCGLQLVWEAVLKNKRHA